MKVESGEYNFKDIKIIIRDGLTSFQAIVPTNDGFWAKWYMRPYRVATFKELLNLIYNDYQTDMAIRG